jgi:uncharacterized protein YdeI (YjbR/CyaY-like superfamily)
MPTLDKRIDAFIAKSAPFARPILTQLRATIHKACPDVVETIKWGMPAFDHHGPLCQFAAFKQHAVFGFWKASLIKGADKKALDAMGNFGRITSVRDLPSSRELTRLIKSAMKLNEEGVKVPRVLKHPSVTTLKPPADLTAALKRNAKAAAFFKSLAPGQRGEYIAWITGAKQEATRATRLKTTVEWLAQGKRRNWKYEKQ